MGEKNSFVVVFFAFCVYLLIYHHHRFLAKHKQPIATYANKNNSMSTVLQSKLSTSRVKSGFIRKPKMRKSNKTNAINNVNDANATNGNDCHFKVPREKSPTKMTSSAIRHRISDARWR